PDDHRNQGEPRPDDESREGRPQPYGDDIPASVTFSEMMRRAAARSRSRPSVWADPGLPARVPNNRRYDTRARRDSGEPPLAPPELPEFDDAPVPPETQLGEGEGGEGPPPPPIQHYEDALEEQRERRTQRRRTRARRRTVGVIGG